MIDKARRSMPACEAWDPRGANDMSKGMDRKKEDKKKPQKSLKEKRAEKRAKKSG